MLLGILNSQAAGGGGGAYELLESTTLSSSAASVTFSGLGAYSNYKHLQIRAVVRTDRTATQDGVTFTFNGDSAANYSWHRLNGSGSSVTSTSGVSTNYMYAFVTTDNGATTDSFGAMVIDILDPFETTKFTTARTLGGIAEGANSWINLASGNWRNTAAVTSITFDQTTGPNFVAGTRFSLMGVK